jgi:anti-anti-sigma factor
MPPPFTHLDETREPVGAVFSCFRVSSAANAVRLMLVGELDLATAERARDAIRRAQAEAGALICDLGDVWFVDLTGLRTLLDAAASAKRNGGRLTIANCPPIVPRMLALLRLEDALKIEAAPRSAGVPARSHQSADQWTDAEWI